MGSGNSCIPHSTMRQSTPFESIKPTFTGRHRPNSFNTYERKKIPRALQSPEILGYMEYNELKDFVGNPLIMLVLKEKERVFKSLENQYQNTESQNPNHTARRNFKKTKNNKFNLTENSKGSQETDINKIRSYQGSSRGIKTPAKASGFGLKSRRADIISKGSKCQTMMDLPRSDSKELTDARGSRINPFVLGSQVLEESQESTQMQTFHSKMKGRTKCQEILDFKNLIHRKLNMISKEQGLVQLFHQLSQKKKIPYVLKTGEKFYGNFNHKGQKTGYGKIFIPSIGFFYEGILENGYPNQYGRVLCLKNIRDLPNQIEEEHLYEMIREFEHSYKYIPFSKFKHVYFDRQKGSAFCFNKPNGRELTHPKYNSVGFMQNYSYSDNCNNHF